MSTCRVVGFGGVILWLGLTAAEQRLQAGDISRKTVLEIKAASVFIKVDFQVPGSDQPLPTSGSGFVLSVAGHTAYIVTNHHVVQGPKEIAGRIRRAAAPVLVFHSGTAREKSVPADVLASDPGIDLAILRVKTFPDFPKPIAMDPKLELTETMGVYTFGFPFGKFLGGGKNPAITVGKGSISSLREDDYGQIRQVQLDGELNPGNSGGPVVDAKGRLVGVAVAKLAAAKRIGLAIPNRLLAEVLAGRVAEVDFATSQRDHKQARLHVAADLVDPFKKMKSVTLYYLPSVVKELPKPNEAGVFPPLPGATRLELTRAGNEATATLSLPIKGKAGAAISYQTGFVNADGKTIYSAARVHHVDLDTITTHAQLTLKDPAYRGKSPHRVHTVAMQAGKNYVIDMTVRADAAARMPGDKGFDPFLYLEDSQGKVLASDDDGGGYPNARILIAAPKTDTYKIIATAFQGAGRYTLKVRTVSGTKETHTVAPDGLKITGLLTPTDPVDPFLMRQAKLKSPSKKYKVRLEAKKKYVIDLISRDFDCVLRVEDASGKQLAWDDDGGEGLNSRLVFAPPAAGVFTMVATCLDGRPGYFTMTLRPE
jgi:hypothetical protein